MSAIKGHSSQKRISTKGSSENFLSVHKIDHNKGAIDALPKAIYPVDPLSKVAEAVGPLAFKNSNLRIVRLTGHEVRIGDVLRFRDGVNEGLEITVDWVETDLIYLGGELIVDPVGTEFLHMRAVNQTAGDKNGGLLTSAAPLRFLRDSVATDVNEDTVDPANNVPLPVKLTGVTGDVKITAQNLDVQSSHIGADPDSIRIGDGTNLLAINADLEATTHDAKALAEQILQKALLTTINDNIAELVIKPFVVESVFVQSAALTTSGFFPVGAVVGAGGLTEIEILYKDGSTIEVFDSNGGLSLGMVSQGGGKIPVSVGAGSQIHLQVKGADVSLDDLTVNLIQ